MWIDQFGTLFTSQEVVTYLQQAVGSSYTANLIESTYRVGETYINGGISFQRIM